MIQEVYILQKTILILLYFFYKRAVKTNPRFDDPKLNLVVVYLIKGNYLEAKKWNESLFHDSNRRTKYRDIINQNINK